MQGIRNHTDKYGDKFMEFPVRCFTCGSVIGDKYAKYTELLKEMKANEALDNLGVERYCCRRMFISYVDIMEDIVKYPRV